MILRFLFLCVILSSFYSCQKENNGKVYTKIVTGSGPEDIVLDNKHNRILVSCNERKPGYPDLGFISQINLSSDTSSLLPLVGLPSIPFNPHGIDLIEINGHLYLYVINHYRDNLNTNSIIQFEVFADHLLFVKEFKNSLLISPNDLAVLSNGAFYFTNDRNSPDIIELITNPNAGSVVYFDGISSWKKADSLIAFPNGLFISERKLFLATSRNNALFTYDIQNDGSLLNKSTLSTINGMDNLTMNGNDLIVSVHTDEVKFALLSFNPTGLSPSRTYSINKSTGIAKAIFNDDGRIISGASTSLVYGNTIYLAQVFGDFVLKIENYLNN